jgi:hypothetical protein
MIEVRTDLQLSEPEANAHQEGSTCWVLKSGEKIPSSVGNIDSRGLGNPALFRSQQFRNIFESSHNKCLPARWRIQIWIFYSILSSELQPGSPSFLVTMVADERRTRNGYILPDLISWDRVVSIATRYELGRPGSNLDEGEIFQTHSDWHQGPHSLL